LWGDLLIRPAVVVQKLPAMPKENLQIRIGRIDPVAVQLFGGGYITIEVERPKIPIGILEHYVLVILRSDAERLRTAEAVPAHLGPRLVTRGKPLLGTRIDRGSIKLTGRFHLGRRQARRAVGALALQYLGIELATRWIVYHAVLDAVEGVASLQRRIVNR